MIGKRKEQRELFDVGNVFPLVMDPGSFYHQLAVAGTRLFRDADFAKFYSAKPSRPSVPPSQLALMTLLQHYTGCSDAEAAERSAFDLRWAAVLGKPAGEQLCAKSTFQMFRAHLVLHDEVRVIFVKSIKEAKKAGLLKKGSALKVALDTKPVIGRGAVEDTYNLLSTGITRLVRVLAGVAGQAPDAWAGTVDLGRYFGSSVKGSAGIDWSDEQARMALLTEIVVDARRLLRLAGEKLAAGELREAQTKQVRGASDLLEQLLLQDVNETTDEEGNPRAEVKKGTTPGRTPSATDPEQRHGHKSKSKRFNGHKAAVAVDSESQIITDVDVLAGNVSDAEGALKQVERTEANTEEKVAQTTGDCAYGNVDTREEFAEVGRDLAAKVPGEGSNGGRFPKSAFAIDLEQETVTCPGGQTVGEFRREQNGSKAFCFGSLCAGCPLREQCTAAAGGRTVRVHRQEAMRAAARAYQETPEGRARLQGRVVVEHVLARLGQLGIGQARYVGRSKTRFQLMMAATIANLRLTWNWEAKQEGTGSAGPTGAGKAWVWGLNEAQNAVRVALRAVRTALLALRGRGVHLSEIALVS